MNKTKLMLGFCALLATGASAANYAVNYTAQQVWYIHPVDGCTETTIDQTCLRPVAVECVGDRIASPSFGLPVYDDQACNIPLYKEQ